MHAIQASCAKMFTWNFPILLFVLVAGVVRVDAQRSCYTPYSAFGQCVPYNRCSYLTQQLEKFGANVPPQFIEFIRNSRCPGSNNQEVMICCEKQFVQPVTTVTTPTPSPPQITPPRDNVQDIDNQPINERGLNILKAIECGEVRINKVSNGNKTKLNEFPFMALLKYDDSEPFQCGGTLITNRFVISAPHCWVGRRYPPFAVRLGEHDYSTEKDCEKRGRNVVCNPPVEDYGIEKFITHPLYKQNKIHHDIGLLRLDREVIFENKIHIKPICMPIYAESRVIAENQEYLIAGWGKTEKSKDKPSTLLLKATIPYHPRKYCQDIFKREIITDSQICAGGNDMVDSCLGDSGGPLFYPSIYNRIPKYVQFGIVSNGVRTCGETTYPTVYTKIAAYLPWLTNAIAENEL